MSTPSDPWLIAQLGRLAKTNPERFDTFLKRVQANQPDIYEELALMAVENGDLSPENCAICLETDEQNVNVRLEIYRQVEGNETKGIVIETDEHGVARLSDTGVKVWEIVHMYRKLGSIEALKESYLSLTDGELRAALRYADRNAEEVEARIAEYEKVVERTKAAYPSFS